MKRAALAACLFALTAPAFAQTQSETGGPMGSEGERQQIALRVQGGASCTACDLFQIDLSYQVVSGRDFSGSRIRQSNLSIAIADRANFRGANLSLANMFGVRATGADFTNANLQGATLVGGYFGGARFNGAVLNGANLSGAELASAHGLSQAQLNDACGDATTQLPAGLTVPNCR
jgi:uncharacterized protein YjbI with pentapeptide repeats